MHTNLALSSGRGVGTRRLSAASRQALAEVVVRVADLAAIAATGVVVDLWLAPVAMAAAPSSLSIVLACLIAGYVLPPAGGYPASVAGRSRHALARLAIAWLMTVLLVRLALVAFGLAQPTLLWAAAWFASGLGALLAARLLAGAWLADAGATAAAKQRVALVGSGEHLRATAAHLARRRPAWARAACVLDLEAAPGRQWPGGMPALRDLAELQASIVEGRVDRVLIAVPGEAADGFRRIMAALRPLPVDIDWAPELASRPEPPWLDELPLVRLDRRPIDGRRFILKAIEDRVLGGLLLLLCGPLMLAIAAGVKLTSPGPVFYRQLRHGIGHQLINVYKFRTMHAAACDAPDAKSFVQARRGDPRVTPFGRFLRRTSLDELPQLLNVLKGEMSLVGPRPHPIALNERFAGLIADYACRHRVKPGITGLAQVNGCRGETTDEAAMYRRLQFDLQYARQWSVLLDLRILCQTAYQCLARRDAY